MSRRLRRSLGIYRTLCCFRPRPPICTRQCNGERALSRWRLWFMSVGDRFGALNFTSSSRRLAHSHGAYGRSVKTHASRRNAHARACTHSRTHARARARAHTHTHTHTHTHAINTFREQNKNRLSASAASEKKLTKTNKQTNKNKQTKNHNLSSRVKIAVVVLINNRCLAVS